MRRTVLITGLVALFLASPAAAYFERVEVGGRALGMGKAFHAIADDPSAVYWNPAGLAGQKRPGVLLMHYRPFVVEDLSANYAALAYPTSWGTAGLAWHHTGLADVTGEDIFSFALARTVRLGPIGTIDLGGTAKILRISYDSFRDVENGGSIDYGSETHFAADIGALYRPAPKWRAGLIIRDIGEPHFDFVPGNGGTLIATHWEGSVAYRWREESTISAGLAKDHRDQLAPTIGGEVTFYDVFALRSGLFDYEYWGGFGILTARWTFDAGFATHKMLGVSYMASITIPFGRESR
ncbi:MAG: conjugal transfer protein TraF [Candidatus Eisenbacteria bacterium]|nr:conjugal transfer protein TraF [Candidatus Eisenbacteria bacterium]